MKITFKREKRPTGLHAVGYPHPDHQVKVDGKEVGRLVGPTWQTKDNLWSFRFAVKTDYKFRWMGLKRRFKTAEEGREWIRDNFESVVARNGYTLYQFDNE